jgi:hypothetical protein
LRVGQTGLGAGVDAVGSGEFLETGSVWQPKSSKMHSVSSSTV